MEILKADLDNGYTPIANLILEALALSKMGGVQKGICLFLFRRTYGWGMKEDEITLKEFAEAVDSSPSYISKQLKQLIGWNVIIRTSYQPGKTPTYTFNTRVAQWDKGCINVQGLNKKTRQGLYKCARVGLHKSARVEQSETLDDTELDGSPKESINKYINKNTSIDEQAQKALDKKSKPKKKEPKYSEDDKAVANHLKAKLNERGVTALPRNWHLKEYATAKRLLKKSSVSELKDCIDWLFADNFWYDKVDSLLAVERQLPKFQLKKGAVKDGKVDPSRGDSQGRNKENDLDKLVIR